MDLLPQVLIPLLIIGGIVYLFMRRNRERARNAPLRSEIEARVCFETALDRASILGTGGFGGTRGVWVPLRGPKRLIVGTDAFMVSAPQALREFVFSGPESSIAFGQAVNPDDCIMITGKVDGRQVQLAITRGNLHDIWQALARTGAALVLQVVNSEPRLAQRLGLDTADPAEKIARRGNAQPAHRRTFATYSHHVIPSVAGGDRRLRAHDTPAFTMLNLAVLCIAAASALVGGVSWLLTFTPWTQFMSSGYFQPFFLLIFPLFGWSVFVRSVRHPGRDRRATGLLNEFPRRWRLTLGLIVTAVFATSLAAIVSLPGQPEYEPSSRRYVYNDHGKLIPATHAAYLHAVAVQNRLFLGAALVFTSFAVAITWQERNRRRRDLVRPEGLLRPVRPRPKIPLVAAALALAAAVALAGSIASGALIYDRLAAYNADGINLRTGHPVRVLLGPDHYVVYVGCTEETICAQLPLSGLSVRTASGGILATSPDPSSDHLDQAVGEVSFTVPVKEVVSLDLSAHLGQPAFVISSEGEEAHALIGWIILAGLSLLVLIAALLSLGMLVRRQR